MPARKVGDAFIRIFGDTRGLAESIRRAVRGVKLPNLPVRIDPDLRGFARSVSRATSTLRTGIKVPIQFDPESIGRSFQRVRQRLTIDMGEAGEEGGERFLGLFARKVAFNVGAFSTQIGSGMANALVFALAAGIITLAPVVGAALNAALTLGLSGLVIGGLIATAATHPRVKAAWTRLGQIGADIVGRLGKIMAPSVERAVNTFATALKTAEPALTRMAQAAAPIVDLLAPALAQMGLQMLPGIEQTLKNSKPFWEALAKALPEIGTALGNFFVKISENEGTLIFFQDMLLVLIDTINFLGDALVWLGDQYVKVADTIAVFIEGVQTQWAQLVAFWEQTVATFVAIGQSFATQWSQITSAVRTTGAAITAEWERERTQAAAIWGSITSTLSAEWNRERGQASAIWAGITGTLSAEWNRERAQVAAIWAGITGTLSAEWNRERGQASAIWSAITGVLSAQWNRERGQASAIWSAITSFIAGQWRQTRATAQAVWNLISNLISAAINRILGFIQRLGQVPGIVRGHFERARAGASAALSALVAYVGGIPSRIVGALAGLAGMMYRAGVSALSGLADGIREAGARAIDAARNIASEVAGAVAGLFKFGSPSKLFAQYGRWLMEGFAKGVGQREDVVGSAVRRATDVAPLLGRADLVAGGTAGGMTSRSVEELLAELRRLRRDQEKLATAIGQSVGRALTGVEVFGLEMDRMWP